MASRMGYCDEHQSHTSNWGAYAGGKDRHQRGYGTQWNKLRKLVIQRDKALCQECLRNGRPKPGRDVDHIVPKARGGDDSLDNLQFLCRECHAVKTGRESSGRA